MDPRDIAKYWLRNNFGVNKNFKLSYCNWGNHGGDSWARIFFVYSDGVTYGRISLKIVNDEVVQTYPKSYGSVQLYNTRINPFLLFSNPELDNEDLLLSIKKLANWIHDEDIIAKQFARDSRPKPKNRRKALQGYNIEGLEHKLICDYLSIGCDDHH